MKKNLIGLMLMFPVSLMAQNVNYTLKGKIGNLNAPAKVYLGYTNATASVVDSTAITNGQFEFKGTIKAPVQATLVLSYTGAGPRSRPAESMGVYLEAGLINISSPDSLEHATIKGANINADHKQLQQALEASDDKMAILGAEYAVLSADKRKDKAFMAGFMADYIKRQKVIIAAQNQIKTDFIRKNPNSMVSLDAIKAINRYVSEYTVLYSLFNSLSADLKNTDDGRAYARKLEKMKVMEVGTMALDFTQNDVNGKPIKLSDYKGKYVLVDFWASWCSPCRAENPNVVKAYNKYHGKGLEILAVSLDKTKEAWLAAIKKDGLTWTHVSDLRGWKNEVGLLYGISGVPQNLLLDKTGRIIAKNLRAEALDIQLGKVFK
jgi:peroxiredoxin